MSSSRELESQSKRSTSIGLAGIARASLFLFAIFAGDGAEAQADWVEGWYAGGGISATQMSPSSYGRTVGGARSSRDTGYVITAGYRRSRLVAFEAEYLDGGSPSVTATTTCSAPAPCTATLKHMTALEGSANLVWVVGHIWELYLRGGVAFWDAAADQRTASTRRSVDKTGVSLMFGAGAGVRVCDHLHARIDYQEFGIDDALLPPMSSSHSGSYEQVSLELHWRF